MKLTYRPEIDGLRAIAVGAVILYHAHITILGYQPFKGGFIGVDIFFVISGYLITSIILKELITTGSFSFKNFYERRIRRILPALLFVMLASLPFAWFYLLPDQIFHFSNSIVYSLGFISNLFFHFSGNAYFGVAETKPLLHTWSLSIEEQYYILFPIFLIFIFKFLRKYLFHSFILIFFISLGLADFFSKVHPGFNFYILPTRGWELLAGSILAYFEIKNGIRCKSKSLNLILPIIGLLLIILSILFFDSGNIRHPSFYTLIPVIGTCLIIWFSNKDDYLSRLLSLSFFSSIGLISYSLYLWHYPIFIFNELSQLNYNLFIILILTFSISFFSYYFVEKPFRNKKNNFKFIFSLICSAYIILFLFFLSSSMTNGHDKRYYSSDTYSLSNYKHSQSYDDFLKNYNYNNYNDKKNVLIVGNCFGWDVFKIFTKTNLSEKFYFSSILLKNKTDAFQITHLYQLLTGNKKNINFNKITQKQYNEADYIILASQYTDEDIFILPDLLKILKSDNKKVLVFNQVGVQPLKYNSLLQDLSRLDFKIYNINNFPSEEDLNEIEKNVYNDFKKNNQINSKIKNIVSNQAIFFERERIFCNENKKLCFVITDDGYKVYWDHGHITDKGAEFFARIIEKDELFLKYLNPTLHISSN